MYVLNVHCKVSLNNLNKCRFFNQFKYDLFQSHLNKQEYIAIVDMCASV